MKILIVDDEMMIKEWLKHTISTLPFNVTLLETASNGLEALEQVQRTIFDLIFIDITMPKMNGIDLLRKLNELAVDSMLVVLSSHDEFQFAKEAIKYNIKEYVLKNECSREKLSEILNLCSEKMQNQQGSQKLTQEFMERVLNGHIPEKGLSVIKQHFPKIVGKLFFVATAQVEPGHIPPRCDTATFNIKYEGLIAGIEELSFLLFSIESLDSRKNYNYDYSGLLNERMKVRVSCGKLCRDIKDLLPECRNSWIGYQDLFYSSKDHCAGLNQYHEFNPDAVDSLCEAAISDIRSYNKENTLRDFEDLNAYFAKTRPSEVDAVVNVYQSLVSTFIIFNNAKSRDVSQKLNMIRSSISSLVNFDQLSSWVLQMVESNIDLVDRSRYSQAVEDALEYIELNYSKIENVSEIAEHVNLSPDYFSRHFRKEVGETLNSYLINFRLDKASIILLSSNLTIQEVAQRVGIENGSYFSKCFKKKFNTQPIQFRIQTRHSDV